MLSYSHPCFSRAVISLSLVALLLIAPLSFTVSGHPAATSSKSDDRDYFTIYQSPSGETVCREATYAERIELERIQPSGLRQISHVQPSSAVKGHEQQSGDSQLPAHLTIILRATSALEANAPAKAAFIRAAQTWENQIKSPVTIYLDADFGSTNFGTPWGGGIIGSTSSPSISRVYQTVRSALVSGASTSAETSLYNSMSASALPTNRGDQTSMSVSSSIARALGLLDPTAQSTDNAARIGFNSAFVYDFDPTNGIDSDKTDFEAVATHEIGHALGFTSRAGRTEQTTPAIWDMFRFRTGTTLATFGTAQRIMTADGLQYFFDGNPEVGLSTGGADGEAPGGDGNQSSHWKQQSQNGGAYIGIMDPTIGKGERRLITSNDTNALNSFGYNLDNSNPPPPPPPPPPAPANNNIANAQVVPVAGCIGSITGTNIASDKESGEPSHSPDGNAGGGSVWYNWQAPSTGQVNMTTAGSNYDTLLGVYTGSTIPTLVLVTENDDVDPGVITSSTVTFNATAGTVYRIVLDGWGGESGNFVLNWRLTSSGCTNTMTAQLSASGYQVVENAGNAQITVNRTDTSAAATVDYATGDTSGLTACQSITGAASERCDYQTAVGTLRFAVGEASKSFTIPIIDDARAEGNETFTVLLKSSTGALLNSPLTATVTIVDDGAPTLNPIEGPQFFITMQYVDFLGRLPDSTGLANWMNTLTNCPNGGFGEFDNPSCDRVHVSSGFFLSDEFRGRGYWAYRFYEVAFDRRPTYAEFVPDMAKVGGPQSPQSEELSKSAYKDDFVQRGEFTNRYNGLSNSQFVDAIEANAEVDLDNAALTAQLNSKSRAQLLREIVESPAVENKFFIRAFVAMQYFGYLRRDPDTVGYNNWVSTLTANPADFRHMIFGFIYSDEYRLRFGQ